MMPPAASPCVPVDYGEVRGDFEYFLARSTETAAQIAALRPHLERQVPRTGRLRMLDFGCGAGLFTERLLRESGLGRERIELSLVEPVAAQLREAHERLEPWVVHVDTLAPDLASDGSFDLILANHSLYYVPDLDATAAGLLRLLAPRGRLIAALLDRRNALARLWRDGFAQAGMPFPCPLAEDAEAAFRRLGPQARRETIRYTVTLPDQPTARRRVLRFLLGPEAVLRLPGSAESLFEPFTRDGRILIETTYPHLIVQRPDG
jgi:SAM-dependent methyltransferase